MQKALQVEQKKSIFREELAEQGMGSTVDCRQELQRLRVAMPSRASLYSQQQRRSSVELTGAACEAKVAPGAMPGVERTR